MNHRKKPARWSPRSTLRPARKRRRSGKRHSKRTCGLGVLWGLQGFIGFIGLIGFIGFKV